MERSELFDFLTNSLLMYLPDAAVSLSNIIETLQKITTSDAEPDEDELLSKINHILKETTGPLLANATEFVERVESFGNITAEERVLFRSYLLAVQTLVNGLHGILEWMKDENGTNDGLSKSIDTLFESSQLILNIVEEVTKT